MELSRQEYWSRLPFPSPGDLPDPEIKPWSPALQENSSPSEPSEKPHICIYLCVYHIFLSYLSIPLLMDKPNIFSVGREEITSENIFGVGGIWTVPGRMKKAWIKMKVKSLSRVQLFATPWTVAYQAPPSMGFSRQECWSGLPFPSPGIFPTQADALPSEPPGKPLTKDGSWWVMTKGKSSSRSDVSGNWLGVEVSCRVGFISRSSESWCGKGKLGTDFWSTLKMTTFSRIQPSLLRILIKDFYFYFLFFWFFLNFILFLNFT